MQRAVRPKPVAAMLAASPCRGAFTSQRSLTIPVRGLPCSQKNRKLALSTSLRNWSSSGDRVCTAEMLAGFAFCSTSSKAGQTRSTGKASPIPNICRRISRRECRLALCLIMPSKNLTKLTESVRHGRHHENCSAKLQTAFYGCRTDRACCLSHGKHSPTLCHHTSFGRQFPR